MCSIQADENSHKFVVGTCSLSAQNEIHMLNFAEDTNRVDLLHVFPFPEGEIWDLKASPYNHEILSCSY